MPGGGLGELAGEGGDLVGLQDRLREPFAQPQAVQPAIQQLHRHRALPLSDQQLVAVADELWRRLVRLRDQQARQRAGTPAREILRVLWRLDLRQARLFDRQLKDEVLVGLRRGAAG